jgi:hypothetical protein
MNKKVLENNTRKVDTPKQESPTLISDRTNPPPFISDKQVGAMITKQQVRVGKNYAKTKLTKKLIKKAFDNLPNIEIKPSRADVYTKALVYLAEKCEQIAGELHKYLPKTYKQWHLFGKDLYDADQMDDFLDKIISKLRIGVEK